MHRLRVKGVSRAKRRRPHSSFWSSDPARIYNVRNSGLDAGKSRLRRSSYSYVCIETELCLICIRWIVNSIILRWKWIKCNFNYIPEREKWWQRVGCNLSEGGRFGSRRRRPTFSAKKHGPPKEPTERTSYHTVGLLESQHVLAFPGPSVDGTWRQVATGERPIQGTVAHSITGNIVTFVWSWQVLLLFRIAQTYKFKHISLYTDSSL